MARKKDTFKAGKGVAVGVRKVVPLRKLEAPKYGWVRLRVVKGRESVHLRLDENQAKFTSQVPRLEQVEVPFRMTRTWWAGQTGERLTIPCLLDGWPYDSVEDQIAELEEMAKPVFAGRPWGEPRPLKVTGIVPGAAKREWVLTGIEQGEAIWRQQHRVRQHFVLSLTRWVDLDRAEIDARKNQRKANGEVAKRTATVRPDEDLATIAGRVLGDQTRWREIARLNPHKRGKKQVPRRSRTDVRRGETLKLPKT